MEPTLGHIKPSHRYPEPQPYLSDKLKYQFIGAALRLAPSLHIYRPALRRHHRKGLKKYS